MVRINILKRETDGMICGIEVSGHSGYASQGHDIVCAGVSSLVYTALNSLIALSQYEEDEIGLEMQEGYMRFHVPVNSNEKQLYIASIIFETTKIGMELISDGYPKNIKIETVLLSDTVKAKNRAKNAVKTEQIEEEQDYVPRVNYARRVDF
jgi:uncharacterized protein YsxB (DUF464 family)